MASRRHHSQAVVVLVVTLTLGFGPGARAVEFAGGTGEPNDPYQIATAQQFMAIGREEKLRDKHFVLVADIDLDPSLPGGEALGGYSRGDFRGSLDGQGHTIMHLTGTRPLFIGGPRGPAALRRNAIVCNLVMRDVAVSKGPVLASVNEGLIVNCSAEGVFEGGLIGTNYGHILNCSTAGTVTGGDGLVETNLGTIRQCYSTAAVTGGSGLVGVNFGTISRCYATGTVSAPRSPEAGGLVGVNTGTIEYCYATGAVSSATAAAGLVGRNSGVITQCYACGSSDWALISDRGTGGRGGLLFPRPS